MTPDWIFVLNFDSAAESDKTYCPNACPHYSKGETFPEYEPFVEIEHAWSIEETATDGVQASLCEGEVPDSSRETRSNEGDKNNDQTKNGR